MYYVVFLINYLAQSLRIFVVLGLIDLVTVIIGTGLSYIEVRVHVNLENIKMFEST